ncbi:MAG: alpha-E domain-containing protein [Bernardetiaceae bacterium]|jgi:uncharacterized alpha-E superfamily protein|nr:alpha-E domain-containing protein [Bernardetiaceae bacterium]
MMLSRIGNSLFWLGRYLERAEHLARYVKVQYVSSLDAPLAQRQAFVQESVLRMAGANWTYQQKYGTLSDQAVLHFMTVDELNPGSIMASVNNARENARGARDSLSAELWEEINKFYHQVNNYSRDEIQHEGPFDFAQMVEENCAEVKGYADNSLPRNEVWQLLSLGMHLERAAQVCRILQAKLTDIGQVEDKLAITMESYLVMTMLKSAESFDMSKRHYKTMPSRNDALEFLIFNPVFPKSIYFNLQIARELVKKIALPEELDQKGTVSFAIGKMAHTYRYLTIEDVTENPTAFLQATLQKIYDIAASFEQKYLSY